MAGRAPGHCLSRGPKYCRISRLVWRKRQALAELRRPPRKRNRSESAQLLASASTHADERLGFDQERNAAFASLLAINIAVDHRAPLAIGGSSVVNFAETVLIDVPDGFTQEIAEKHISVGVDE